MKRIHNYAKARSEEADEIPTGRNKHVSSHSGLHFYRARPAGQVFRGHLERGRARRKHGSACFLNLIRRLGAFTLLDAELELTLHPPSEQKFSDFSAEPQRGDNRP